jgi:hypothetical protein
MTTHGVRQSNSRVELYLRVKHPSLDPVTISKALNIQPEHAVCAGESTSKSGKVRLHSESYWLAKLPSARLVPFPTELLNDDKELAATASAAEKLAIQKRHFESTAFAYQGLSKDELLELIGASPFELLIMPWLRKLNSEEVFFKALRSGGGSAAIVVQIHNAEHSLRLRPNLTRQLAQVGIDLEIEWSG